MSVAIVATRLRSERLGELRPEQRTPSSRAHARTSFIGLSQTRLRKLGSSGVTSSMHWLADVARPKLPVCVTQVHPS
jgi:hypothetical protein